jgi:hypothetical protein
MTLSISHLQEFAKTKGTKVIAHKIASDYKSAVIVLESGPKLTVTEDEVKQAIEKAKPQEPKEKAETPAEKKARLKAEAEAKAEAEKKS